MPPYSYDEDIELLELEAKAKEKELLEGSVMNPSPDFESGTLEVPDDPISMAIDYGIAGGIQGAGAVVGEKLVARPFQALTSRVGKWAPKIIGGLSGAALAERPAEIASGRELGPFDTLLNTAGGLAGKETIGRSSAEFVDNPANITGGPNRTAMAAKLDPKNELLTQALQPRMGEFTDRLSIETSLKNAQKTGYLADVKTIDELIAKVKRDVGEGIKEEVLDPSGKPIINETGGIVTKSASKEGLLGQKLQGQIARLSAEEDILPIDTESVLSSIEDSLKDLKREALARGAPQEIEAIDSMVDNLRSGYAGREWNLSNLHESRTAFDGQVNYANQDPQRKGSLSARATKQIADVLRRLEDSRAKDIAASAGKPELYNNWVAAKSEFQVASELRDSVIAQGARNTKRITDSNAVKDAALAPGSIPSKVLNAVFPRASSENMFKKSQVASGLRGNPVPNMRFSDFSNLARGRRAFNEVGGGAIGGATTGALRGIASPADAQAMNTPSLTQTRRFSQPQQDQAEVQPQIPSLPRDTSQWNDMAVAAFLVQTRSMGAEAVGYKLADAYKKAEKLGDKSQQEKIVADMSKLFPQFFEPGMGVNGKIFHADDQKEYMSKLESAQRRGLIGSSFLAEQRDAFLDRNDLKVRPVEGAIADSVVALPQNLRPVLPGSGARTDPY